MSDPAYPAARLVAKDVAAHFSRHLAHARTLGRKDLAPEADAETIEAIIDAAFWASLRREEGLTPKISLAFVPPRLAGQSMTFQAPLKLRAAALAKLAPAVERPGIHLGVWPVDGELHVWGTTRDIPASCLVVEVVGSGLLVVKHRAELFGKFVNVAVLEGDAIKIVDEGGATVPDCPGLVKSLLGFESQLRGETVNVLVQLAASMRRHGRGGALLVVPTDGAGWHESVVSPVLYAVDPPFSGLADLMANSAEQSGDHEWQEDLRRSVEAIAGLTAVDGATVMNERYALLAFGAKIARRRGHALVEKIIVTEPVEGSSTTFTSPTELGGTRHLSAAQFVHDQQDATALVASQDGRFTIFKWSPYHDLVHAHRVEALLL